MLRVNPWLRVSLGYRHPSKHTSSIPVVWIVLALGWHVMRGAIDCYPLILLAILISQRPPNPLDGDSS